MANPVSEVLVTENALQAPPDQGDVSAGGIVEFKGVVRALEGEREIEGIEYEANRAMAEHQLRRIAEEAIVQFQLKRAIIHHRIGFVRAGEPSLFLRVAAGHRAAAFSAAEWMVDELKKRVPIWKKPKFAGKREEHSPKWKKQAILQP